MSAELPARRWLQLSRRRPKGERAPSAPDHAAHDFPPLWPAVLHSQPPAIFFGINMTAHTSMPGPGDATTWPNHISPRDPRYREGDPPCAADRISATQKTVNELIQQARKHMQAGRLINARLAIDDAITDLSEFLESIR